MMFFATLLFSACSTFVAYPGPALPDSQVATLKCFWRYYFFYIGECHITAIDGQRRDISHLMSLTSKLKPGDHWAEFEVEHYFAGAGGTTDVCAFDFNFEAGYQYQIKAHSLESDIGWLAKHNSDLFTGSVSIEATSPTGQTRTHHVKTTCSPGGSLCRKTSDCVPHPDMNCFQQEGYLFGRCGLNK